MRNDTRSVRHLGRSSQPSPHRRGELGLLAQGSYGRWTFDVAADQPQEVFHLYLPTAYLDRVSEQADNGSRVEIREKFHLIDPVLQMLMRAIDAALDHRPVDRLYIEGLATAIAARLISEYSTATRPPSVRGGLAPWQLKRAQEAMAARLDADLGLDDLATITGCSPTHFSRAFKQSTGIAPFRWLSERRIEKAKLLLAENRLSLAEIALAVGFSAQAQFTTAFGRATGVTPGAWRRERLP